MTRPPRCSSARTARRGLEQRRVGAGRERLERGDDRVEEVPDHAGMQRAGLGDRGQAGAEPIRGEDARGQVVDQRRGEARGVEPAVLDRGDHDVRGEHVDPGLLGAQRHGQQPDRDRRQWLARVQQQLQQLRDVRDAAQLELDRPRDAWDRHGAREVTATRPQQRVDEVTDTRSLVELREWQRARDPCTELHPVLDLDLDAHMCLWRRLERRFADGARGDDDDVVALDRGTAERAAQQCARTAWKVGGVAQRGRAPLGGEPQQCLGELRLVDVLAGLAQALDQRGGLDPAAFVGGEREQSPGGAVRHARRHGAQALMDEREVGALGRRRRGSRQPCVSDARDRPHRVELVGVRARRALHRLAAVAQDRVDQPFVGPRPARAQCAAEFDGELVETLDRRDRRAQYRLGGDGRLRDGPAERERAPDRLGDRGRPARRARGSRSLRRPARRPRRGPPRGPPRSRPRSRRARPRLRRAGALRAGGRSPKASPRSGPARRDRRPSVRAGPAPRPGCPPPRARARAWPARRGRETRSGRAASAPCAPSSWPARSARGELVLEARGERLQAGELLDGEADDRCGGGAEQRSQAVGAGGALGGADLQVAPQPAVPRRAVGAEVALERGEQGVEQPLAVDPPVRGAGVDGVAPAGVRGVGGGQAVVAGVERQQLPEFVLGAGPGRGRAARLRASPRAGWRRSTRSGSSRRPGAARARPGSAAGRAAKWTARSPRAGTTRRRRSSTWPGARAGSRRPEPGHRTPTAMRRSLAAP